MRYKVALGDAVFTLLLTMLTGWLGTIVISFARYLMFEIG